MTQFKYKIPFDCKRLSRTELMGANFSPDLNKIASTFLIEVEKLKTKHIYKQLDTDELLTIKNLIEEIIAERETNDTKRT